MARYYGLRLRLIAAATAFCGSIAITAAATLAPEQYSGTSTTMSKCECDGTYTVTIGESVVLKHEPAFLLAPVIDPKSIKRDFPVERRARVQPHATGNAIRLTSVAGGRSGLVRQLASR